MGRIVFVMFVICALLSAYTSVIDDCDEVYNYWEPVHLLLYGSGFQTWEYAPQYALRSYWYPGALALIGAPLSLFQTKLQVFFLLRAVLGLFYASCAFFFFRSFSGAFGVGAGWARLMLATGLGIAPGLFSASSALLPNSFSMCLYMLSFGCWMRGLRALAVIFGAMGSLLGVPFSVIVLGIMALVLLLSHEGFFRVFVWGCIGAAVSLVPQFLIDRYFYGKWVCAVCNIISYNALDNDSTLYGVEPASFYLKNLLLNLNIWFVLAIPAVLWSAYAIDRFHLPSLKTLDWTVLSSIPWLAFMFAMPHKEQRFLYPVYPLLVLGAASLFRSDLSRRIPRSWLDRLGLILLVVCVAASASRLAALQNRRGSTEIWRSIQPVRNATICLGDEWYRFPSSFWLPDESVQVEFIRGGFRGLLPKKFARGPGATSLIPTGMNSKNVEERSRYVDVSVCDYLVEEEGNSDGKGKIFASVSLLDDVATPTLSRAFVIPFVTRVTWKKYQVRKLN